MKLATICACMFSFFSATFVAAERNLIPILDNPPDVCPGQPTEPDWMRSIVVRESHKRLLVQQIYRAQSMRRIVDARDCACTTRYPSWETAESVFFESFAAAEYWVVVDATSEYRRLANELRLEAMRICEAGGNW